MNKNYYVDAVMGDWHKDSLTEQNLIFKRSAKVKLHRDYAIEWIDPVEIKSYWVWGDVVLQETKLIDLQTSHMSFMRGLELTPTSEKSLKV